MKKRLKMLKSNKKKNIMNSKLKSLKKMYKMPKSQKKKNWRKI